MSRSAVKRRRRPERDSEKLRQEIDALKARLREMRARLETPTEFDISDANKILDLLVERVERNGERLYLCRGDKRVVGLVPADEAEHLDDAEDKYWRKAADEAMQEPGTVAWENAKKELGL